MGQKYLSMRQRYLLLVVMTIVVAGAGIAGVQYVRQSIVGGWVDRTDIPDDTDELILFSIDGSMNHKEPEEKGITKDQELLYDFPILGRVVITDPKLRREIIASVKHDIRSGGVQDRCFYPRHVLRVKKDSGSIDVVICFECHNYQLHRDGGPHAGLTPSFGERSKELMNKVLTDAGVHIAP
jgi:hypothetical protein